MTESKLSFGTWLATEGGSRCPQCGRYAKPEELGSLSFAFVNPEGGAGHVCMHGHLPGFGCNKSKPAMPAANALGQAGASHESGQADSLQNV